MKSKRKAPAGWATTPGPMRNHASNLPYFAPPCKVRLFTRAELLGLPAWNERPSSADGSHEIDRAIQRAFPALPGFIRPLGQFEWLALSDGGQCSEIVVSLVNCNAVQVALMKSRAGDSIGRFKRYLYEPRYDEGSKQ